MKAEIITYYLEMTAPSDLRPASKAVEGLTIQQAQIPCPELSRFLYMTVGGHWYWTDRLGWTHDRWLAYLDRPEVETWIAYSHGTIAGYAELEKQSGGNVEIAYFGLLPQFVGQGLGGRLLSTAVQRAWAMQAARVWVHTCTLDHPAALTNYLARGFRLYSKEVSEAELPEQPVGPWPGARRISHQMPIS